MFSGLALASKKEFYSQLFADMLSAEIIDFVIIRQLEIAITSARSPTSMTRIDKNNYEQSERAMGKLLWARAPPGIFSGRGQPTLSHKPIV